MTTILKGQGEKNLEEIMKKFLSCRKMQAFGLQLHKKKFAVIRIE